MPEKIHAGGYPAGNPVGYAAEPDQTGRGLHACAPFSRETGITEEMAHALIERVEVSANNSVSIRLRWQDEYKMLADFLKAEQGAAL